MKVLIGVAAAGLFAATANGQFFYATNNLANTNFGTGGDELIIYDWQTAAWASQGLINIGGNPILGGFGGLDWGFDGTLVGAVSFGGAAPGEIYSINPANGNAVLLGNALTDMSDLAFNPVDGKMYGTDAGANLWVDNDADHIPETFVGTYNIATLETGLGFDAQGNIFVQDLITDIIYKGTGANPGTLVPHITYAAGMTNFSQGLYVGGTTGYHGMLNNLALTSENWQFDTNIVNSHFLVSTFAIWGPTGLPEVEVGDLTPVPGPGSLALLALGGLALRRRRR